MHGRENDVLPAAPFGPQAPLTIPDHELLRLIGRGAYGEVWLARNAIGTLRAVKIVHRWSFQRVEHFEREFKGLLKFEPISRSHDGLVDILQIGRREDAGYFYYVMELADAVKLQVEDGNGKIEDGTTAQAPPTYPRSSILDPQHYAPHTLRAELQQRASLPPAECVALGLKLASALEHLHANGLVHRDIKPSNIIFVNGEPKLADIGLVTSIDDAHSLVGTAGYIPPEGLGTPQADIFALGKVLYEAAFGKDRQEFPQLPPNLESHPDYAALLELNEIILKACESDPRQRYASAASLARDLALLQHGQSVKQARRRARRWKAARQSALVTIGLAGLATTVTLVNRTTHGHTPEPEAARLYDRGRWYYNQLTPADHAKALDCLRRAIQIDPLFVRPYGELTALYVWNELGIEHDQERLKKTREIAQNVMAIDPNTAEEHTALSWCHFLEQDWHGAEGEVKLAIKFNPKHSFAHALYCYYLSILGRTEEAHREGKLAQELDPPEAARVTAIVAAWPYMAERRYDKAIEQLQQVLDLDPNFSSGHSYIASCYEAQSNYPAAIEEFRAADWLSVPVEARAKVTASYDALRQAYDKQGGQGYFREWIELVRADESLPEDKRLFFAADLAGCYARLGENQLALDQLEKHFDDPNFRQKLMWDGLFDSLHEEPRFKALVKRAGLEQ